MTFSYYNPGMKGIGSQYDELLSAAGEESGLTKEQIVVRNREKRRDRGRERAHV